MNRSIDVAMVSERPSNAPGEAGPDRRITATRWSLDPLGSSTHMFTEPKAQHLDPAVEVQAFIAMDRVTAHVSLVLHGRIGYADLMLAPDEARAVALTLLTSADEAEALTRDAQARDREMALVAGRQ